MIPLAGLDFFHDGAFGRCRSGRMVRFMVNFVLIGGGAQFACLLLSDQRTSIRDQTTDPQPWPNSRYATHEVPACNSSIACWSVIRIRSKPAANAPVCSESKTHFEEAKRDYLELIRRRPTDFGALNDFGTLVLKAGYRDAARSLFGEAVRHHPGNPNGHVNLANLLFLTGEASRSPRFISKRRCGSIPTMFMRIAAWAISWPSSATRRAPGGIATRVLRITS